MKRDLKNNVDSFQSVAPAARTTTVTGAVVDLSDYEAAMVHLSVGTITDGTHTPKLQEADTSGGSYTDVAADDLEGSFAALASNVNQRVGYKGNKPFVKVVVTVTGSPSTGGVYGADVFRGKASHSPV